MKALVWLAVYLVTGLPALAQSASLAEDPLFRRFISREVRFPREALRYDKSTRVFVCFTIDGLGDYKHVHIVNSLPVGKPFEEEITRLWSKLPRQPATYAGTYVLPIAFLLGDGSLYKSKPMASSCEKPVYREPYELLREVSVTSFIACEQIVQSGRLVSSPLPKK